MLKTQVRSPMQASGLRFGRKRSTAAAVRHDLRERDVRESVRDPVHEHEAAPENGDAVWSGDVENELPHDLAKRSWRLVRGHRLKSFVGCRSRYNGSFGPNSQAMLYGNYIQSHPRVGQDDESSYIPRHFLWLGALFIILIVAVNIRHYLTVRHLARCPLPPLITPCVEHLKEFTERD